MFLKTHIYGGKIVLINLDDVSYISHSPGNGTRIFCTDGRRFSPLESGSEIVNALKKAKMLIETDETDDISECDFF